MTSIELIPETPGGTISRTAMETGHKCLRQRYLAYEIWRGQPLALPDGSTIPEHCGGLSPAGHAAPLVTGGAIHEGFASLLRATQQMEAEGSLPPWNTWRGDPGWHTQIDVATQVALTFFDREVEEKGISFGFDPGPAEFYRQEQRALVEGLVWVAGLRLVPELISRYRVVEVEREERMVLGEGLRPFAARADALLAERDSGDLSVFSLKTAAIYGKLEEMRFKRDVQGLSEAIAIERRMQSQRTFTPLPSEPNGGDVSTTQIPTPRVETVQMALLLKGLRKAQPAKDNRKEHYSPLVRAYRLRDPISGIEQWAWSYDTPKTARDGSTYMGKLGKDWEAAPTWEREGGIRQWVLDLDQGKIQPEVGDPLASSMALPEPWARAESEMADWLEQAHSQEERVEGAAQAINAALLAGDLERARKGLNHWFPQNRSACVAFARSCSFDAFCWANPQGLVQLSQGIIPEGLTPRVDHHGEEGDE